MNLKEYSGTAPDPLLSSNLPQCDSDCYLKTQEAMSKANDDSLGVFQGQSSPTGKVPIYAFWKLNSLQTKFTIHYWIFFPYNKGKRICLGVKAIGGCLGSYKRLVYCDTVFLFLLMNF